MPSFNDRTSPTWFGRDDERARLSLLGMSSRAVITTYEVEDNRYTRSVLSGGGRVVGSERSTAVWSNPQAYESLRGYRNLIEADRQKFGSRLHAKIGEFTSPTGDRVMFVGTANMTKTGLGMSIAPEYRNFSGGDKSQFNYYVASRDPRLVRQMDRVLGAIMAGRAPTSTENLLVTSPADTDTAARTIAGMISDRSNHAALFIASATLSDRNIVEAIIQKAQRGDQVWVGLGGLRPEDFANQQGAFTRLAAAARTLKNLHVGKTTRPWHANVIAMGDTYVVGSARFSTTALRGFHGEFSTEVLLRDRSRAIAEDIARNVRANTDFASGEQLYLPFTELGTYMPAMLPLRSLHPRPGRPGWQFIVDPAQLFNTETRTAYAWLAAQNPGRVPGAGRGVGFFEYLYTEMYAAGHDGRMPSSIPSTILQRDIDVKLPSHGELWRGRLTDWANERFDSKTASLVSQLTAVRGNRGPLGTLMVNLGIMADRQLHHSGIEQARHSLAYRPTMPKEGETYAELARWVDDNLFNLATNVGMLRLTFAAGSMTAAAWTWVGQVGQTIGGQIDTIKGGPVATYARTLAEASRQASRIARTAYMQTTKAFWDIQRETYATLAGVEGQAFIKEVTDIYAETKPRAMFRTTDDRLALQMRRYWGGKIRMETIGFDHAGRIVDDATQWVRTSTEYIVEHDARNMTMLQRWRAMHASAGRFASKLPLVNAFSQILNLEPNPHAIAARQLWWDSTKAYMRGDFARGARLAQDSYVMRRSASLMLHGEGGLPAGAALLRRAVPLLFAGALIEHGVGMVMSAGQVTLEEQVRTEREMNRAGGAVQYFGVQSLIPKNAWDIFPALSVGTLWGVSWLAQFAASMFMNPLDPGKAVRRATRMTEVATDLRGYEPYREIDRPGLKDTSVSSVVGFFIDNITAMQRHATKSLIAARQDLMYKVVSKNMATQMMTAQTERMPLSKFRELVVASAGTDPHSRKELASITATLDMARDWSGRGDKAEVTTGLAYGLRIGHLALGSVWGGAIYTGGRWNFMFSAMGPVGMGVTLGFKAPLYYSTFRGRDQFKKWLAGSAVEENTLDWGLREILNGTGTSGMLRYLTEATGGEAGWLGGAVQTAMGLGYQPGTNWEALVRLGAGSMALAAASTPAALAAPGLAYGAAAWYAHDASAGPLWSRVRDYYRTGEFKGAGFSLLDNIARGTGQRFAGATMSQKFFRGAIGFSARFAGFALDLPANVLRAPLAGIGYSRQVASTLMGGSYEYRTSKTAMLSRGIRSAGRLGMAGFMAYTAYAFYDALHTGTVDGYAARMRSYREVLKQIPLLGTPVSRLFAAVTSVEQIVAKNPEDDRKFAAGPIDSLSAEMGSAGDRGRFKPGAQGLWNMVGRAAGQVSKALNLEEVFMTAESYSDIGLHWIFRKTGPDTMEMAQIKIGKPMLMGQITPTAGMIMSVVRPKTDRSQDYQMARAMTGNRQLLESGWVGRGRPAFMGRMFSPQSATYGATPALKLALAIRWEESRAALGMWPSEYRRFKGDHLPWAGTPMILDYVTYTAQMRNDEGPIKELVFGKLADGAQDFQRTFEAHRNSVLLGLSGGDTEDDIEAMMARSPLSPGNVAFGTPAGARTMMEARMNWLSNPTTLTAALAMGTLSALPFVLGTTMTLASMALRGRGRRSVAEVVDQYMPKHRARVMGVVLSPEAPGGRGGHAGWTLTAHRGLYRVDIPRMGGEGVTGYGDVHGRPFTHTVDPTGTVTFSGRSKAAVLEKTFNHLLAEYESMPVIKTAGGLNDSLGRTYDVLRRLEPSAAHMRAGYTPSAEWMSAIKRLDDFRTTHLSGLSRTAHIADDVLHGYEQLVRSILSDFGRIGNAAPLDMEAALRSVGMEGRGWWRHIRAMMGLTEQLSPPTAGAPQPFGGPRPVDAMHHNTSTLARAEHIAQIDARMAAIAPTTKTVAGMVAGRFGGAAVGAAVGYYVGGGREGAVVGAGAGFIFKETMWVASRVIMPWQIASGVAAQAATGLTDEQRKQYREYGGVASYFAASSVASWVAARGAEAVGTRVATAAAATAARVGATAIVGPALAWTAGVVGGVAASPLIPAAAGAAVLGLAIAATFTETGKRVEKAFAEGVGATGRALGYLPGAQTVSDALVNAGLWAQLNLSEGLWAAERAHIKNNQLDGWGRAISVVREVQESVFGFAPAEMLKGPQADQPGRSWTLLADLWRTTSPIWWGSNRGIGWALDAMQLEVTKQERIRLSGAIGRETVLSMVAHETLGIMSGSNEFPQRAQNLQALYMERGRGAGGMGNMQARRAFRYHQLSRPDQIIQAELLRRGIFYETGILGGVMRRPGHPHGGFVGGAAGVTTTGRARPTLPGSGGKPIKPAGGGDLRGALGAALFVGTGGGPNAASVTRWNTLIEAAARRHQVPAGMLRAIMSLESGGRADATSYAGAIGLMQVMPFHFTSRGISGARRYDPATNIEVGAQIFAGYYKAMQKRVAHLNLPPDRVLALAVASYNTGPGWKAYDRGQFPMSWDGYSTAKSYSDTVMKRYHQTKSNDKPLLTASQQKHLDSVLPQYLSGKYAGSLDKFMVEQGGLSPAVAKTLAGRVRNELYAQGRWLPEDDPAAWNKLNASLGRIASAKEKAEAIMDAAGIKQPAAVLKAGARLVTLAGGTKVVVPKGWEVTKTGNFLESRPGHLHGGVDYVLYRYTDKAKKSWTSVGAPILAAEKGYVESAATSGVQGFGSWVVVRTADGRRVIYGHPASISVRVGDQVEPGTLLGTQGAEGRSSGIHVHREVRDLAGGLVDPGSFSRAHPVTMNIDQGALRKYEQVRDSILKNIDSLYQGHRVAQLLQERLGFDAKRAARVELGYQQLLGERGFSTAQTHTAEGAPIKHDVRDFTRAPGEAPGVLTDRLTENWVAAMTGVIAIAGAFASSWAARKTKQWFDSRRRQQVERTIPEAGWTERIVPAAKPIGTSAVRPDPVRPELIALREQMEGRAAPESVVRFRGEVHRTGTAWNLVATEGPRRGTLAGYLLTSRTAEPATIRLRGVTQTWEQRLEAEGLGVLDPHRESTGDGRMRTPEWARIGTPPRETGSVLPWADAQRQPAPYLEIESRAGRTFMVNREAWLWLREIRKQGGFTREVVGQYQSFEYDEEGTRRSATLEPVVETERVMPSWTRGQGLRRPFRPVTPQPNRATPPEVIRLPGRVLPHRDPLGRFMKAPEGTGARGIMDLFVNKLGTRQLTTGVGKYSTPSVLSSPVVETLVAPPPLVRESTIFHATTRVAGGFYRKENWGGVVLGTPLELVPEPTNLHDPYAVQVRASGRHIGYVPAEQARSLSPLLQQEGATASAQLVRRQMGQRPYADAWMEVRINLPETTPTVREQVIAQTPTEAIRTAGPARTPVGYEITRGRERSVVWDLARAGLRPAQSTTVPVEPVPTVEPVSRRYTNKTNMAGTLFIKPTREGFLNAVRGYTGVDFSHINYGLHNDRLGRQWRSMVVNLNYWATPLKESMQVHRGQHQQDISNKTFISTSVNPETARTFAMQNNGRAYPLVLEAGTRVIFVGGGEGEVIVAPGQANKIRTLTSNYLGPKYYGHGQAAADSWHEIPKPIPTPVAKPEVQPQAVPTSIRSLDHQAPPPTALLPATAEPTAHTRSTWQHARGGVIGAGVVGLLFAVHDAHTLKRKDASLEERERARAGLGFGTSAAAAGVGSVLAAARGLASTARALGTSSAVLGAATMLPDLHQLAVAPTRRQREEAGFNVAMGGALLGGGVAGGAALAAAGVATLPATLTVVGASAVAAGVVQLADYKGYVRQDVGRAVASVRDTVAAAGSKLSKLRTAATQLAQGTTSRDVPHDVARKLTYKNSEPIYAEFVNAENFTGTPDNSYSMDYVKPAMSWSDLQPFLKRLRKELPDDRKVVLNLNTHGGGGTGFVLTSGYGTRRVEAASAAWVERQVAEAGFKPDQLTIVAEACNAATGYKRTRDGMPPAVRATLHRNESKWQREDYEGTSKVTFKFYDSAPSADRRYQWFGFGAVNTGMAFMTMLAGRTQVGSDPMTKVLRLDKLSGPVPYSADDNGPVLQEAAKHGEEISEAFWKNIKRHKKVRDEEQKSYEKAMSEWHAPMALPTAEKPTKKVVTIETGVPNGRQGKPDTSAKRQMKTKPTVVVRQGKAQVKGQANAGRQGRNDTASTQSRNGLLDRTADAVYNGLVNTGWF